MIENQKLDTKVITDNLIYYRKKSGLTQSQLAEKISYSDKTISKWERGEAIPDVLILFEIAKVYGISVDDFLTTNKKARINNVFINKFLITMLSIGLVWFVFTLAFFILVIFNKSEFKNYLLFIYAIPVSGIVLTIFINLYFHKLWNILSVSIITWGLILSLFLSFPNFSSRNLLFIVGVPFEILTIIFYILKARKEK